MAKAVNVCGEGEFSDPLSITLNPPPETPLVPDGNTNLCSNATETYTIGAIVNTDSYLWEILPVEAGVISGDGVNAILNLSETYTGTANIKVKGANSCGEGDFSDSLQITISSPVASDLIGKSGIMIIGVDSGYMYQWYLNGLAIFGASKMYYYNENMPAGNYQLEITDSKGCSSMSGIFPVGTANKSLAETIKIYPNPATQSTVIEIDNDYTGKIKFKMIDNQGKVFKNKTIYKEIKQINIDEKLSGLNPGVYLFEFIFNDNQKVSKQVIVR